MWTVPSLEDSAESWFLLGTLWWKHLQQCQLAASKNHSCQFIGVDFFQWMSAVFHRAAVWGNTAVQCFWPTLLFLCVPGIIGGLTSVITSTVEGVKTEGGVSGFISGLGKGLVGTVTKPVAGALDFASETAQAVRDTATLSGPRSVSALCCQSVTMLNVFYGTCCNF